MKLLVDVGNSRVKWTPVGTDGQAGRASVSYVDTGLKGTLERQWKPLGRPDTVHVSNVAGSEAAGIVREYCLSRWSFEPVFAVPAGELLGLSIAYPEPERLGVDRWLAMLAVWRRLGTGFCLVDCGTAVTIDLVRGDGRHLGGYILPGTRMMQELLNSRITHLRIEAKDPETTRPGTSTTDCLINGAGLAVAAAVDRCAHNQEEDSVCILTGGGAAMVSSLLGVDHDCIPELVLEGLGLLSGTE